MKAVEDNYPEERRTRLRKFREAQIRKQHSGNRKFLIEEWISLQSWRKDQTELSMLTNAPPDSRDVSMQESFINNNQATQLTFRKAQINHELRSVTLDQRTNSMWAQVKLWQAYTIEPEAAIGYVLLAAARPAFSRMPKPDSLHGLTIDEGKVSSLMEGKHDKFQIWVEKRLDTQMDPVTTVRIEGRSQTDSQGIKMLYVLNEQKKHIHKIQLEDASGFIYTSIRDGFDADGFPKMWETTKTEKGRRTGKRVVFLQNELQARIEPSVFSPTFPTNYIVYSFDKNGKGEMIQNPRQSKPIAIASVPGAGFKHAAASDDKSIARERRRKFVLVSIAVTTVVFLAALFRRLNAPKPK